MTASTKRKIVYIDSTLHKILRLKSLETSRSMSELINDTIRESIANDSGDLEAFDQRADEPLISYDEMVKRLKKDGRI